jgi:hypothetical protein
MAFRLVILLAMAAVGTALAAVAAGSSPHGVAALAPEGDEATTPIADCEATLGGIEDRDPGTSPRVRRSSLFAGPIVFLGAKSWRNFPRKHLKPERRGVLRPAKVPIYLKADHEVTVTVLPPAGHRAIFGVGLERGQARGTSVIVRSCPGDPVPNRWLGPWTWMPAGFRVDAPMCVGIEVHVEGATQPITKTIAFGRKTRRTCPGRS